MKRQAGFTLIELTVVLAVVVVLSGFLVLRVTGWTSRQSLNNSARVLGEALRTWRERARFDEMSYQLSWKERSWTVSSSTGERMVGGVVGSGQSFEREGQVSFDRRGTANPATIALRHASGVCVLIKVDVLQSSVSYEERR